MPIINQPTKRNRADQADILLNFASRLTEHPLLNNQNVVISDQPIPEQMPGGAFCLTISPGAGSFPTELWSHATATEDGSVIVGIFVNHRRDRPGRKESALLGRWWRGRMGEKDTDNVSRPGLISLKRTVLSLLSVQLQKIVDQDYNQNHQFGSQAWEPSKDGIPLCRNQIAPIRATGPMDVPGFPGWIGMQITFSVTWDWDLYADPILTINPLSKAGD